MFESPTGALQDLTSVSGTVSPVLSGPARPQGAGVWDQEHRVSVLLRRWLSALGSPHVLLVLLPRGA